MNTGAGSCACPRETGQGIPMSTSDQVGLFFVMLGSCCDAARLGNVAVELELDDGSLVQGVPQESALADAGEEQLDHSGTRDHLLLDGVVVDLQRVRRYTISHPG